MIYCKLYKLDVNPEAPVNCLTCIFWQRKIKYCEYSNFNPGIKKNIIEKRYKK